MRRPLLSVALSTACLLLVGGCRFEAGGIRLVGSTPGDGPGVAATGARAVEERDAPDCVRTAFHPCRYVLFVQYCADRATALSPIAAPGPCTRRVVRTFPLRLDASALPPAVPTDTEQCVSDAATTGCASRSG